MVQYRAKPDRYKSWIIQKRTQNESGDWSDWTNYKFPGNVQEAALGLMNLSLQNFVSSEVPVSKQLDAIVNLSFALHNLANTIESRTKQIVEQLEQDGSITL